MASRIEAHPDNVGASLFGGIVVAYWDGERAEYIRLNPPEKLKVLAVIPDFQLSTHEARNALPQQVSLQDAVFNVSHSSLLVAALAQGNLDMIRHAMKDQLHQPYRASLVPGMEDILARAVEHGALGVALSGAGPTMLALVDADADSKQLEQLETFMQGRFADEGIQVQLRWLQPEAQGVRVLSDLDASLDLTQIVTKGDIHA